VLVRISACRRSTPFGVLQPVDGEDCKDRTILFEGGRMALERNLRRRIMRVPTSGLAVAAPSPSRFPHYMERNGPGIFVSFQLIGTWLSAPISFDLAMLHLLQLLIFLQTSLLALALHRSRSPCHRPHDREWLNRAIFKCRTRLLALNRCAVLGA
jgi:hypothetical protein